MPADGVGVEGAPGLGGTTSSTGRLHPSNNIAAIDYAFRTDRIVTYIVCIFVIKIAFMKESIYNVTKFWRFYNHSSSILYFFFREGLPQCSLYFTGLNYTPQPKCGGTLITLKYVCQLFFKKQLHYFQNHIDFDKKTN